MSTRRRVRSLSRTAGAALGVAVLLAGCSAPGPSAPKQVVVGVVTSRTGADALDGQQWTLGFQAALDAATSGSGEVGGLGITVDYRDDASDAATAAAMTDALIDEGATVIAGPVADATAIAAADAATSGAALFIAGSATTDELTGRSRSVFRSGHQVAQEVAAAARVAGDVAGRAVAVLAPDDAPGQAFVTAASAELAALGATAAPVTPAAASTSFVLESRSTLAASPAAVIVRWPGSGAPELWRDLAGTDSLGRSVYTTQLGNAAAWDVYGPATGQVAFLTSYAPGLVAGADDALVAAAGAAGVTPGAAAADGYLAGLMVAKAAADGRGDLDAMILALEGATFEAATGSVTVRPSDHALLADEFRVSLATDGEKVRAALVGTLAAGDLAPPEKPIPTTGSSSPTG